MRPQHSESALTRTSAPLCLFSSVYAIFVFLQLLVHSTEEEGSSSLQDFSNLIIHTLLNLLSTPDIEVGGMGGRV